MSEDYLAKKAEELVDEFLKTRGTSKEWSWQLRNRTGEVVVVVAIRNQPKSTKAALGSSGEQCPLCGGSGRI